MIIFPSSLLAMPQGITMDFLLHEAAQSKKRERKVSIEVEAKIKVLIVSMKYEKFTAQALSNPLSW